MQVATIGTDVLPLVFFYDIYCDDQWYGNGEAFSH
jgi:hypothetical protein